MTLKQTIKGSPFLARMAWPLYRELLIQKSRYPPRGAVPTFSGDVRLEPTRLKTFEDYLSWSDAHASELCRHEEVELAVSPDQPGSFSIPGWCALCGRATVFNCTFDYASRRLNGRLLPNLREQLFCAHCGLKNRLRAALHLFVQEWKPEVHQRIYTTEQLGAAYRWLKGRYTSVYGSEYIPQSGPLGKSPRGIRNEDLGALTWPDETFDFVLSFDVLEHVPDVERCFSEICRCLKLGGGLLFTAPFVPSLRETLVRAVLDDTGTIRHRMEPEYHGGNMIDAGKGTLCFRHFGWDVIDQLQGAGFAEAEAWLFWSRELGYIGDTQVVIAARKR